MAYELISALEEIIGHAGSAYTGEGSEYSLRNSLLHIKEVASKAVEKAWKAKYDQSPPDYGYVMTVSEFIRVSKSGYLTNYDGCGYAMVGGKMDGTKFIYPSNFDGLPKEATHICWFNR